MKVNEPVCLHKQTEPKIRNKRLLLFCVVEWKNVTHTHTHTINLWPCPVLFIFYPRVEPFIRQKLG